MSTQPISKTSLNCRFVGDYQKLQTLGEGTYGIVFFAKDKNTEEYVAIKKMKVFDHNDGFPITSLRQVKILKMLSQHPNIIALRDVAVGTKKQSVFLVFQYCDIDLHKLIEQMSIDKSYFLEAEIKCLALQLIKGVSWAHSKFVIHRDLKLTNLLLNKKGILKIADFGLAKEFQIPYKPLTRKVVTLWYRAPQLLIKNRQYGPQIDVWSIGCILGQLLQKGLPIFQGTDQLHQFKLICELIGYPTKEQWPQFFEEKHRHFRKQVEKFAVHRTNNLRMFFREYSNSCIDLLGRMICWNSKRRITLNQALYHPYFYESPKSVFPDQIKVLAKLEFYSKKSSQEVNKKKNK